MGGGPMIMFGGGGVGFGGGSDAARTVIIR
jgi:hypothetical protein